MRDGKVTREAMLAALATVPGAGGGDLVSGGLIDSVHAADGKVRLALLVPAGGMAAMRQAADAAAAALRRVAGVREVQVVLTAERASTVAGPAHAQAAATPPAPAASARVPPSQRPKLLPQVTDIVAVASGKGGVGKSTTAVNLAVALARSGLRVGLLDADIHGPSLPTMLGVAGRPEVIGDRIQPIVAWGLRAMSMGFLVDQATAMIWRGPMVMGALEQLMGQVDWGELDIMILDMPPGTGDAQLTVAQRLRLSGAVIVSTPQDVALMDARRGVRMFEQTGVRVLGLIENMSYFDCPACGARSDVFGHGGARDEAGRLGVPFLGAVPLLLAVREASDAGVPVGADSAAGLAYAGIAGLMREALAGRAIGG